MKLRKFKFLKSLSKSPLTLGFLILTITILALFLNEGFKRLRLGGLRGNLDTSVDGEGEIKTPQGIENWEYYVHPEYKFSLYVPELLIKREYENPGDYLFFVRFEANRVSESKGLAIGVSERNLEEEEKKTRELIEVGLEKAEPTREELKLTVYDAIRLDYEGLEGFEPRTVILVTNNGYTYSISTNPEQMDKVLSGFVFID